MKFALGFVAGVGTTGFLFKKYGVKYLSEFLGRQVTYSMMDAGISNEQIEEFIVELQVRGSMFNFDERVKKVT